MQKFVHILENEIKWLGALFDLRKSNPGIDIFDLNSKVQMDFVSQCHINPDDLRVPVFELYDSMYANFVSSNKLTLEERVLLILALAPNLYPSFVSNIFNTLGHDGNLFFKDEVTGGSKGELFRGILPTGLTFIYLVAGNNLEKRIICMNFLLMKNSKLFENAVIDMDENLSFEPFGSGRIRLNHEFLKVFILRDLQDI